MAQLVLDAAAIERSGERVLEGLFPGVSDELVDDHEQEAESRGAEIEDIECQSEGLDRVAEHVILWRPVEYGHDCTADLDDGLGEKEDAENPHDKPAGGG